MKRPGAGLYRLVYASRSCAPSAAMERRHLREILEISRARNAGAGITGALTLAGGTFGQVLEGSLGPVEAAFERIERDGRHRDLLLLDLAPIPARSFGAWPMAFVLPDALSRLDEVVQHSGFTAGVRAGERLQALLCDRLCARRTLPFPGGAAPPHRRQTKRSDPAVKG